MPGDARSFRVREANRLSRHRVVDEAEDVRALADELGFEQFGFTGGSGGGPTPSLLLVGRAAAIGSFLWVIVLVIFLR